MFYYFNHTLYTFWENDFSTFSPYKCVGTQKWPCRKNVKGHPRINVWKHLGALSPKLLYTKIKFQGFLGSGEGDFYVLIPYIGHGG